MLHRPQWSREGADVAPGIRLTRACCLNGLPATPEA
jgi:hypothetical protein